MIAQTLTKNVQDGITPDSALEMLKAGNKRFVDGTPAQRDLHEQVSITASGQYPYAIVQGCIDSRVPLETVFDAGVGDIFGSRVAGNVVNVDQIGGMEYACNAAGSKLIVILGHTACGAVTGAVKGLQMGNLSGLLGKIRPAVVSMGPIDEVSPTVVNNVVEANVRRSVVRIREESQILSDLEAKGQIKIVGAMYDVASGKVTFLD